MNDRYLYIFDFYGNYNAIWDGYTEQLSAANPIPKPTGAAYGCVVGDGTQYIYYFGGYYGYVLDTTAATYAWTSIARPPTSQTRQSCVYYPNYQGNGDVIFMQHRTESVMHRYWVNQNEWETFNISAPITRFNTDAVLATDDKVYIIAGEQSGGSTKVQVFDPNTNDVVEETALLPAPCGGPAQAVAVDDEIYVFGGYNSAYVYLDGGQVSNTITRNPTSVPTAEPTTAAPTTDAPTDAPTAEPTAEPTTADPTTAEPTTAEPTGSDPTTAAPTTAVPTFDANVPTAESTSAAPTTAESTQPTASIMPSVVPTTDDDTVLDPDGALMNGIRAAGICVILHLVW
eukprot:CAMPEP_0197078894 /NCGR_PEP_ID=MMETSP1384-20130603/213350_1 /TAXON_ID=29189 /ORGANISM="Ammonia sp." /LENGTH=342 /DNA_ID=CAMNT_0042517763 /DNA_START=170 /DNA_END=1195 /DNA_ORIENTATION=-